MVALSHEEARGAIYLAMGAALPFILRTIGDWIINKMPKQCCDAKDLDDFKQKLTATSGETDITIYRVINGDRDWNDAVTDLKMNACGAVTIATARLLFWHWLQPILYAFVLYAYWDLIDEVQRILGLIVGGREALYWILTVIAVFRNPVYLLVDLSSTWKKDEYSLVAVNSGNYDTERGKRFIRIFNCGLYVIAPEKYVMMAITKSSGSGWAHCCVICFLPLMDLAGAVALIWAFIVDKAYGPLIIGYTITTIGGIFVIGNFVVSRCIANKTCGCCCKDNDNALE